MRDKTDKLIGKFLALLQREYPELLKGEDDADWEAWYSAGRRSQRDISTLLSASGIRLSIRARALVLLYVPHYLYHLPGIVNRDNGTTLLSLAFTDSIANLLIPEELHGLLARMLLWIEGDYLSLQRKLGRKDRSSNVQENLVALLVLLKEDDPIAEQVFSRITLRDPEVFCGLEDMSGYQLYERMVHNPKMPEKWKWLALASMEKIIKAEETFGIEPRVSHERAINHFVACLRLSMFMNEMPFSKNFFAEQVRGILGYPMPKPMNTCVGRVCDKVVSKALDLLQEDEDVGLLRDLIHFVVFDNGVAVKCYDQSDLTLMERMRQVVEGHDVHAFRELSLAIAEGRERVAEQRRESDEKRKAADDLMNRLK